MNIILLLYIILLYVLHAVCFIFQQNIQYMYIFHTESNLDIVNGADSEWNPPMQKARSWGLIQYKDVFFPE